MVTVAGVAKVAVPLAGVTVSQPEPSTMFTLVLNVMSAPLVLRTDFAGDFDPKQLHKLMLAMRPDDSWHRLDITMDLNGQRWMSTRTTWLAQSRPMSRAISAARRRMMASSVRVK